MRRLLQNRFSGGRFARIVGWTTAAVTWGAVAVSSALGAESSQEPPSGSSETQPNEATTTSPHGIATDGFPAEPAGGLVILRGIPAAEPQPVTVVKRVVVQSPARSVSPAPSSQSSSGS
jgi:hypothetical protein